VWELVEDNWHLHYKGTPPIDVSVWQGGEASIRVLRGGSWQSPPRFLRSASRNSVPEVYRFRSIGFRVARTL
jgi:formylglycine-generating enzyme required for sulfatase activity